MCVTQTDNTHITQNIATSNSTVDTNAHIFEIQFDGTSAVFFIDGVLVGTQSGNVPSASTIMGPFIEVDNINTANAVSFDMFSMRGITIG